MTIPSCEWCPLSNAWTLPTIPTLSGSHHRAVTQCRLHANCRLYADIKSSADPTKETKALVELFEELHLGHYVSYRNNSWFLSYQLVRINLEVLCKLLKLQTDIKRTIVEYGEELSRLISLQDEQISHVDLGLREKIERLREKAEKDEDKIARLLATVRILHATLQLCA